MSTFYLGHKVTVMNGDGWPLEEVCQSPCCLLLLQFSLN